MGHFAGKARVRLLAAIGISATAILGISGSADTVLAASTKAAANDSGDAKKDAAAGARKAYDAGLKAYAAGKHQAAVDQLSAALRAGGFSSGEMAKALYTRGLAYKQLKKPGLAISDLTSALWLKNGLDAGDRKIATEQRAEAYRMAGLGDGNSGADAVAVADPNPAPAAQAAPASQVAASAPAATTAPAPVAASANAGGNSSAPVIEADGVTRQSPDSEKAREAAAARRLAAQQVDGNGLQAVAMQSVLGDQQSAPSAPAPSAAPPAAPSLGLAAVPGEPATASAQPAPNGGSAIGKFFSNLFSGGASPSGEGGGASSVTTASTEPSASTSSWSNSTSVATGRAAAPAAAKKAVVPVAAEAAQQAKMTKGKYKIHIAALRSRAEAEALAQQVVQKQGGALKNRVPVVDEAVIGSMGTFYRVRVGSYATAEEPRSVCNTLRSSGFDCLVVTK